MQLDKPIEGFLGVSFKALDAPTDDKVVIQGFATKKVVDRDGDLVIPKGIDLTNYQKNPILLFNHNQNFPVGKVIDIIPTDDGLMIKAEVYKDANDKVYNQVRLGILKTFSIGFRGLEGEYNEALDAFVFTKAELFEISIVSVPANQQAIFDVVQVCENGTCALASKSFNPNKQKGVNMEEKYKELKEEILELKETIKSLQELLIQKDEEVEKIKNEENIEEKSVDNLEEQPKEEVVKQTAIDVIKEIWDEDPDEALKQYEEIHKFINDELNKILKGE